MLQRLAAGFLITTVTSLSGIFLHASPVQAAEGLTPSAPVIEKSTKTPVAEIHLSGNLIPALVQDHSTPAETQPIQPQPHPHHQEFTSVDGEHELQQPPQPKKFPQPNTNYSASSYVVTNPPNALSRHPNALDI